MEGERLRTPDSRDCVVHLLRRLNHGDDVERLQRAVESDLGTDVSTVPEIVLDDGSELNST